MGIAAWCHNRDDLMDIDPFLTTFISMVTTQVLLSAGGPLRQQSYQLLQLLLPTWENRDCVEVVLGGPADFPQLVVSCLVYLFLFFLLLLTTFPSSFELETQSNSLPGRS